MSKRLVATHDKIDPALVTAEDLVRAIQEKNLLSFAMKTQTFQRTTFPLKYGSVDWYEVVVAIANLITLPEPTDNRVVWRGEMPPPVGMGES